MSVSRLAHITPIGVEQMGDLADSLDDGMVLRLENLDTNIPPPPSAVAYTKHAAGDDDANSYLPFFGMGSLRQAASELVGRQSGQVYDWQTECIISSGGLSGIFNTLLAVLEPGDEVLLTDPTYVGLINRVRLAGGVPRFIPMTPTAEGWRPDLDALRDIDPGPVSTALLMSPSMPSGAVFTAEDWQTMIGWRVGWVVGPANILADVARVSITNVVCQTGIAMGAVATAINGADDGIVDFAATPMINWGSAHCANYVRIVFSNESRDRLRGIGNRFRRALA